MPEEQTEHWYRVLLLVDDSEAEQAASALWNLGASGVAIRDRETFVEQDHAQPVPEGMAELTTFFSADQPVDPDVIFARVEQALTDDIRIDSGDAYEYTDTSWQTSWKDYFTPVRLSNRSIVGPPWEDFAAPEDGAKLVIEPGMAFGTGGHETTQLCAQILDERLATAPGLDVLDVGCGSAILSMVARRLGAGRVVAIDHDPTAVDVARQNLEVNGLAGDIDLSTTPVDEIEETFDLVVANILTHILLELRPALQERVTPGGLLVLSGITADQLDSIQREFSSKAWLQEHVRHDGDWCAITWRRRPDPR